MKLCKCGGTLAVKGLDKNGNKTYRSRCSTCRKLGREYKGFSCELCNFIPQDPVQLDVDHIDGNPSNNDKSNLQTLCANCHRLKTKLSKDWIKK